MSNQFGNEYEFKPSNKISSSSRMNKTISTKTNGTKHSLSNNPTIQKLWPPKANLDRSKYKTSPLGQFSNQSISDSDEEDSTEKSSMMTKPFINLPNQINANNKSNHVEDISYSYDDSCIIAPNVSKLSPESAVEIKLHSSIGTMVSILCSVDVLKMRSGFFHNKLCEQDTTILNRDTIRIQKSTNTMLWREPITLQEEHPFEAAAFIESLHEGRALFRGDWNLIWAKLSVQWLIEDLIIEYASQIELQMNRILAIVTNHHWRCNPNVLTGMKIAVFRKGSNASPTVVTGMVIDTPTALSYSKVRVAFDEVSTTSEPALRVVQRMNLSSPFIPMKIAIPRHDNKDSSSSSSFRSKYDPFHSNHTEYMFHSKSKEVNKSSSRNPTMETMTTHYPSMGKTPHLISTEINNTDDWTIDHGNRLSSSIYQLPSPEQLKSPHPNDTAFLLSKIKMPHSILMSQSTRFQSDLPTHLPPLQPISSFSPLYPPKKTQNQIEKDNKLSANHLLSPKYIEKKSSNPIHIAVPGGHPGNISPTSQGSIHKADEKLHPQTNGSSNAILGDVTEPFWVQSTKEGSMWYHPDELFFIEAKHFIHSDDIRLFWEMARALLELPSLSHQCQSGIRNSNDLTDILKRLEFRILWTLEAPELLPKSVASELIRSAYCPHLQVNEENDAMPFNYL